MPQIKLRRARITRSATLAFAGALAIMAPGAAEGQEVPASPTGRASTWWYGLTIGGAGSRLTCDLCETSRDVGPDVSVAVGAPAGARMRLGVEIGGWTHVDADIREKIYRAGVTAHLVPDPTRGLYLLAGFGWSGYRAGEFAYDAPRLTVGAGWDVPAFGDWVVGNVVALDASAFASLRNETTAVARQVGLSLLRLSIQLRRG